MSKLKISVGDLVNYKLTRGEWIPGLPSNNIGYQTGVVAGIFVDGDTTHVSLRGGPDAAYGGSVYYHRSRFDVIEKGYETHHPHTGERQVPEAKAEPKAPSAGSKKEQAIAIYNAVIEDGGSRKDGILLMVSRLEMSPACASTYWQNIKSGKWTA